MLLRSRCFFPHPEPTMWCSLKSTLKLAHVRNSFFGVFFSGVEEPAERVGRRLHSSMRDEETLFRSGKQKKKRRMTGYGVLKINDCFHSRVILPSTKNLFLEVVWIAKFLKPNPENIKRTNFLEAIKIRFFLNSSLTEILIFIPRSFSLHFFFIFGGDLIVE